MTLSLLASLVTFAQNADCEIAGIVGAPFSAVRSQQSAAATTASGIFVSWGGHR